MDAAKLQGKVYAGYAKAAKRIGYDTDVFRPDGASDPLNVANKIATIPASFNAEDMKYGKPNKYGKPTWYCVVDGRETQVGDYLQNAHDGIFFIAAQQTILPVLVVSCNAVATFYRPQQMNDVGALGYGGNTLAEETAIMTDWPCSILQGSKGEKADAVLPGDTKSAWWSILVPEAVGVLLRSADIIRDTHGRRFVISSAELTDLGWRLSCAQAVT